LPLPQDGGVSEGFTHKMAACEFCLQDGGMGDLPTRWRCRSFAYKMAVSLRVLPTRWRRGSFAYKMAASLRVLPTRWWRGSFAYKMAAFLRVQNIYYIDNVEYIW